MITRDGKKRLKGLLMQLLAGKLPSGDGTYKLEAAPSSVGEPFLLVKVRDGSGNLETYFEVTVKERF